MAGPCTRRNASGALINDSDTPKPIPTVSCTSIFTLAQAFFSAPASTPGLLRRYIDENLQKATKLALKSFV